MAYKTRKRKVKKNVPEGVVHIHSTFNNTITTISDKEGNVNLYMTCPNSTNEKSLKNFGITIYGYK